MIPGRKVLQTKQAVKRRVLVPCARLRGTTMSCHLDGAACMRVGYDGEPAEELGEGRGSADQQATEDSNARVGDAGGR